MIPLIREPPSRERIYLLGIAVFFYSFFVVNRASGKHTQNTELFMQKKTQLQKNNLCAIPANINQFFMLFNTLVGYFFCVLQKSQQLKHKFKAAKY